MAHEIKNPLTPIQLSAERIAKSYHRIGAVTNQNGGNQGGVKWSLESELCECD
jgi:hypothetical protein